ncbi:MULTISPECIES: helix-turn-helix transcriptional regulator [Sphingomonas]|jgi:predicted DNA-binding transcriptional regulator AlpA|uniref:helix-turn-helix transcriptional regulator n=1 Tax=Sphingomonas TaxID=13687 RepID=UPI001E40B403|nr:MULTISPECIES: helix-turn-helix domain-containing protein [Sphingomonas]
MSVKSSTPGHFRKRDVFVEVDHGMARLNRKEAADFLGFAPATLANWALKGYGPSSFKVGGRRFYWLADLERFVANGSS